MKLTKNILIAIVLGVIAGGIYLISSKETSNATTRKLYFYNWSEYLTDEILQNFTEETGIEVILTTYDSNEVMYSKLKMLDGTGYDLAAPSTYYVKRLFQENLLQKLDHEKITNFGNIDTFFLDKSYDPKNVYSIPYVWGATAIGVNTKYIDAERITSWRDLWNEQYKNKLMLINDMREVFHIALALNGHSVNTTDPKEIEQAYELLKDLMPNVTLFNSDTPAIPFISGEVEIGMLWNGSAYMAQKEDPEIQLVYPKEGPILWMDNIVIPRQAENVEEAYKMINYLLRPDVAAKISERIGYPIANRASLSLMTPEKANNKTIYPPREVLEQGEFQDDVGEAMTIYNRYWEKLKTQQ